MENKHSLDSKYFKDVYDANDDPWNFETSEYEASKYAATIAALPRAQYDNVLEIGCSIGVLTKLLAEKSKRLLATDISEKALNLALKRCSPLKNVSFEKLNFQERLPDDQFDLIMVSEVAYYLSSEDWVATISRLIEHTKESGHVVLVHWLPEVHDYPQTGDEVHDTFEKTVKGKMLNVFSDRAQTYRIDVWEKRASE